MLNTDSDLMANMYIVLNYRRKLLEHAYGYYGMELKLALSSLWSNHIITIRISLFRSGSRIQEGWYASKMTISMMVSILLSGLEPKNRHFQHLTLIVIPLITSCAVYKRLLSPSLTLIISLILSLIKIRASLVPLRAYC
jgi:hypothetical protein